MWKINKGKYYVRKTKNKKENKSIKKGGVKK